MYDTQYNRKIANEIDHINKNFIKHNKNLEGAGFMNYLPMLLAGMSGMSGTPSNRATGIRQSKR